MSTMYGGQDDQHGSTVRLTDDKLSASQTNGSSARKFTAQDIEHVDQVNIVGNSSHLVDHAVSLKKTAMTVDHVAGVARRALAVSRGLTQDTKIDGVTNSINVQADQIFLDQSVLGKEVGITVFGQDAVDSHKFVQDLISRTHSDFTSNNEQPDRVFHNDVVPEIDSVIVDMDKKKGTIDCFFATLKFSVPANKISNVKALKITRATIVDPTLTRGLGNLSLHGIDRIRSTRNSSRSKGDISLSSLEKRLVESHVPNAMTDLVPIDSNTNLRNSAEEKTSSTDNIDSSVSRDERTIAETMSLVERKHDQTEVIAGRYPKQTTNASLSVQTENPNDFRQIAIVSPDKLSSKQIGSSIQYSFEDTSISFGRGYMYYVTTVNTDLAESMRSAITTIVVEALRVPEMPKSLTAHVISNAACLLMSVNDQLVEKFEIYRKEVGTELTNKSKKARVISAVSGFTSSNVTMAPLPNGFSYLGDSLNSSRGGGSSFNDTTIVPGKRYVYRAFSVDVFGNKSESPAEVTLFFKDRGSNGGDLSKPYMTAEIDSKTKKMKLTFGCMDKRVVSLFLTRKDLTIKQKIFAAPGDVSINQLGLAKTGQGSNRFQGSRIIDTDRLRSWNGHFVNTGLEIVFVDNTVAFDHTYQYRLEGNDRYGNKTSIEISKSVLMNRHPMIDAPINVSANVVTTDSFRPGGVRVSWQDGNMSVSSESMLGSQSELVDMGVKNLYQVERRRTGDDKWFEFPLIAERTFVDPTALILGDEKQSYRPPVLVENETYTYRVKSIQSGAFVSNYSTPTSVFVGLPVLQPTNVVVASCDAKVRPFYTIINWETPAGSGEIDHWEIQKAVVNNYAAASMNMSDPDVFSDVQFYEFRNVSRESGRFRSMSSDNMSERSSNKMSGTYHFQDLQVTFGNTYFYRIRAAGLDGRLSGWTHGGMKVTNDSFEKKLESIMTVTEREELFSKKLPLVIKQNLLGEQSDTRSSSFSLNPEFSKNTPRTKF